MSLRLLIASAVSVLLFYGCTKDAPEETPYFEIEETYLSLDTDQKAVVKRIPAKTNLDWATKVTSTSNQSWCKAVCDASEGVVLISLEKSTDDGLRECTVVIKSTVNEYTVKIRQLGAGPMILVSAPTEIVSEDGGVVKIKVTANVKYSMVKSDNSDWFTESVTRAMEENVYTWNAEPSTLFEKRSVLLKYASAENAASAECTITQDKISGNPSDVIIPEDIKYVPSSGRSSEANPGSEIENTFNGTFTTSDNDIYHSIWYQSAAFPVELEYFFDTKPDLDYLICHPRKGNGNIGKVKISAVTEQSGTYYEIGEYDFKMQDAISKVTLPNLKKVLSIKFEVLSGSGDYVSCSEMEFFQRNLEGGINGQLLSVFTDITCTEVKQNVTVEMIKTLPDYFALLATEIQNGTYDKYEKSFRIRDYDAYSNIDEWADNLMTKKYSNLDNCMGIYANAGDEIIVLVGDTHGVQVSLQSIEEVLPNGDTYLLNEGVNKIKIKNKGMLFLMYNTAIPASPIKVHIPLGSGIVTGFFDLAEHESDAKYAELLQKASYKYFFVRGEKIIFYFHRQSLLDVVPGQIVAAVNLWDNMVGWQQELMGIEAYRPHKVNNHIMAVSIEEGYMWASDYRMGFIHTYLHNILLPDNVMAAADNAWGPSHEMGHIHQKAINWPGATESSNNLFSNYSIYNLGKYCSRGSELSKLATSRFVDKNCWAKMENAEGGEDTELHMRMNWQLWNYFHRCGYKPNFWQEVFIELRKPENRIVESNPGDAQMKFVLAVCKVSNQNFTDFFEMWGFFEPIDIMINQYGDFKYTVTPEMIANVKQTISLYPAPKHAIQYLEDRKKGQLGAESYKVGNVGHYTQFEKGAAGITKKITCSQDGNSITINDGNEAVAFEVYDAKGELVFFSNFYKFVIPSSIPLDGIIFKAVAADGTRVDITKN